ncbi:hypothetical protein MQE22_08765 [Acidithiobacillus sp. YTS05]|nr:hypothetical protein MQE22_08765 [Acidithiobacillus sp. YTS05]
MSVSTQSVLSESSFRLMALRESRTRIPEIDVEALDPETKGGPHPRHSRREWYTWGVAGSETEFAKGIRFCALYCKTARSALEEAELSAAYSGAYLVAHEVVAYIARRVGLDDAELITDCATALVDFCARRYDEQRGKSFSAYLKAMAYHYLRIHRNFQTFSRRMAGVGYETGDHRDVLTAMYDKPSSGHRTIRETSEEDDRRDVLDSFDIADSDPLFAEDWQQSQSVDPLDLLASAEEHSFDTISEDLVTPQEHATLSGWVDRTIDQVQLGHLSAAALHERAPAILEKLREVSGARMTDIAKRLIVRANHGCDIATTLLRALLAGLHPEKQVQTIRLIETALATPVAESTPFAPGDTQVEIATETTKEDIPAPSIAGEPSLILDSPIDTQLPEAIALEDADLGLLIDTGDLRHGRVPPPKPRYVVVDQPPEEPHGDPPPLDEWPPPTREPALCRNARSSWESENRSHGASGSPAGTNSRRLHFLSTRLQPGMGAFL